MAATTIQDIEQDNYTKVTARWIKVTVMAWKGYNG
jgi:hypothetical protein